MRSDLSDDHSVEPLQILRYQPGEEYRPHYDTLARMQNQRVLTFLIYLNEDYDGGETLFLRPGLRSVAVLATQSALGTCPTAALRILADVMLVSP